MGRFANMAATIHRLRTRADRLRAADAARLRQLVINFAETTHVSGKAVGEIVSAIDRQTDAASEGQFIMVWAERNAAVVGWLTQNSRRPLVAVRLWATLFAYLRHDTQEVVRTRAELADEVGCSPDHVSEIIAELEVIEAVSRRREGREVRYFLNPKVATHLTGAARSKAQKAAAPLNLPAK